MKKNRLWQYKECDGEFIICEEDKCQTCCSHYERDHGICLDCGDEEDPGIEIDRIMDYLEDR